MERQNWDARYFALAVYFWIAVGFLLFPIFIVIPLSFGDGQFLKFPPDALSLRWYEVYVNDPVWMDATFVSLRVAFASGILATVIGTMAVLGRPSY